MTQKEEVRRPLRRGTERWTPFYMVKVEYVYSTKVESSAELKTEDCIKMNELPVDVKYMVYFIRRFLKVQLKGDKEIDYAAFLTFDRLSLTDKTMVGGKPWS